jgi:hypothetical protein
MRKSPLKLHFWRSQNMVLATSVGMNVLTFAAGDESLVPLSRRKCGRCAGQISAAEAQKEFEMSSAP